MTRRMEMEEEIIEMLHSDREEALRTGEIAVATSATKALIELRPYMDEKEIEKLDSEKEFDAWIERQKL